MQGAHEPRGYDHLKDCGLGGTEESSELQSFPPEPLLTPNDHVLLSSGRQWSGRGKKLI